MDKTKITGICMGNVYTNDLNKSYAFYADLLGLKDDKYKKEKNHYYCQINDKDGFFIEGGYEKSAYKDRSARASFSFKVESSSAMFNKLKNAGVRLIQDKPVKMDENIYWFQCYDPDWNIVEFLGGE